MSAEEWSAVAGVASAVAGIAAVVVSVFAYLAQKEWRKVAWETKQAEVAGRCALAISRAHDNLMFAAAHYDEMTEAQRKVYWSDSGGRMSEYSECLDFAMTYLPAETYGRIQDFNAKFVKCVNAQTKSAYTDDVLGGPSELVDPLLDELRDLARYGQPGGWMSLTARLKEKYGEKTKQ